MKVEFNEVLWLDHHHELSLQEIAQLSGLAESELVELVDCGAITPVDPDRQVFTARCVVVARTAARLRRDFELDIQGVSVAMALLARVQELEQEVQSLRALLPHRLF